MTPYVHRRLRAPSLLTLLVLPFVAYVSYRLGNEWFVIPFVAILLTNAWTESLLLRVDQGGVTLRGKRRSVRVPWTSIQEVSLGFTEPPELAVRLKHGAPLPAGVRGAIHDPTTKTVTIGDLQRPVPGVDPLALEGALERFGRLPLMRA